MGTTIRIYDKYGVTEEKKAELDALKIAVTNQKDYVEQLKAITTSLNTKLTKFQAFLSTAENDRTKALKNKEALDDIIQKAFDLMDNSEIAFEEIVDADAKLKTVACEIKTVIEKLIYSAEVVNKLSNLVVRQKALNPLISDELITMITTAGEDANNAVALTLIALKSAFASQATSFECESVSATEFIQSQRLYYTIIGKKLDGSKADDTVDTCLKDLIYQAYEDAKDDYEQALTASVDTTLQLNETTAKLERGQIKLASLEAGLAAAKAAALAS
ncbi:hypothetical protein [uncultured Winogradskyella sp.]|uniref:hypothetical protein n=1 Tax=uncultured Winogradskyella sp. TaxID=395353 RepID=UPI002633FE79|nr:hypothetical protein [uncultured Winogradskyella sp.]